MDFLRALVDPAFMPHGHCYFWQPEMVWLQVVSNLVVGISYLSISITLFWLTRRMSGLPFRFAYVAFGAFIVLCGFTHFMDIVTVWKGVYWLDGAVRALTAVASAATAIWLFPLFPQVVKFGHLVAAERELSRAKLQARERELRELFENLPDLAWSARPDGHVEFYNQRWYEYTGLTPDEMLGWGWRAVQDPAHLATVEARWREALTAEVPFEMEFPLRRKDGSFRWFLSRGRPLRDEAGKVARWIGTCTDIDELRRTRAELRKMVEIRDEFLSIASHELKTPLQSLSLQLELGQLAAANAEGRGSVSEKLDKATKQVTRLTHLVSSLLDVSRVALNRLELSIEEVDLVSVVREIVDRHASTAHKAGSEVTVIAPETLVGQWDRSRIDQVVTNLLTNAIKYGEGRPIELAIEARGEAVELSIRDHGLGIDPVDHERIFARFERAASRNYGGLGLGLFISREITRAHGGDISVDSRAGEGARFVIHLPRESKPAEGAS